MISIKDARTGIQRVVRAVSHQLLEHPPDGYQVLLVVATRTRGYHLLSDLSAQEIELTKGDTFFALDLASGVLPYHWNQLARWKRAGASVQAVVYDLLPLSHPEWFTSRGVLNFRRWVKTLALFADRFHCISNTVRLELGAILRHKYNVHLGEDDLHVFALSQDFSRSSVNCTALLAKDKKLVDFASRAPTVLMVGTIEPRKAHSEVLNAFEELWKNGGTEQLVVVGATGWKTEVLQHRLRTHELHGRRLIWVSDASDALLDELYKASIGVIVASLGEGLGLPILEAQHFGRPILVRDLPVFREVAGPGATFFPADGLGISSETLIDWFSRITNVSVSKCRAETVTWESSVSQLLKNMDLSPVN